METVLRVTIIYLALLVGLRLLGKREFSEMSPLELITLLLIPELVSQSLIREDFSLTNALVAVATLFSLVFITSLLVQRSEKFETLIESTPVVLVQHGEFIVDNLNKERVTPGEVFSAMRKSGLDQLTQIKWAVLEGDGKISIVPEEDQAQGNPANPPEEGPV